ncbi:MAG: hypothetical protein ACO1OC_00600 [Tuberibacillus sp.]
MNGLKGILNWFKPRYTFLYTAIGDEECMKIVGKLNAERIPYKTKIPGLFSGSQHRTMGFETKLTQYKIYVKKGYEHQGIMAMNKRTS